MTSKLDLWYDPVLMAITQNEAKINAGLTPLYVGAINANGVYYPSIEELQTTWTTNTRWEDLVLRDMPVSNNTTVQVRSSNDKTNFMASANYYRDNGVFVDDYYQKFGGLLRGPADLQELRPDDGREHHVQQAQLQPRPFFQPQPDFPGLQRGRFLLAVQRQRLLPSDCAQGTVQEHHGGS